MSLNVYTNINDVPKGMKIVRCNDAFFNCGELKKDEFTDNVLNEIDKANYNSNTTFIGRDKKLGAISMERLSTGCKTLLNIHYHPEICFDVVECGANALEMLAEIKNGRGPNEYAKANAAVAIKELIQTASNKTFSENHKDKHNSKAKFGWYRYDTRFAIPKYDNDGDLVGYNIFKGRMVIRHSQDNKLYLYDILRIKKETSEPLE